MLWFKILFLERLSLPRNKIFQFLNLFCPFKIVLGNTNLVFVE